MRYTLKTVDMTYTLQVQKRITHGTHASVRLRAEGRAPAVLYGGAEKESLMVSFDVRDFEKVWRDAGGSSIVTLTGLDGEKSVLIHDVTVDPLYGTPIHADFLAVRTDEVVEVDVPLVFTGVSPAEKALGGTLIKVMHTLTIEALPKNLPHEIEIDITSLATFEDQILVKDVVLPTGVTAIVEPDEVVALVQEAQQEEEVVASADLSTVEVEKKGKADEATAE